MRGVLMGRDRIVRAAAVAVKDLRTLDIIDVFVSSCGWALREACWFILRVLEDECIRENDELPLISASNATAPSDGWIHPVIAMVV
jgi:hypothetical protein